MTDKKAPKKVKNLTTLKDVFFYYSYVDVPQLLKAAKDKGAKFNPEDPNQDTEWVVKAVISRARFKKLKEKWPNGSNFPHAKEYEEAAFKKAFHSPKDDDGTPVYDNNLPEGMFTDKVDEVVVIKFSQRARTKAGKDMQKPQLIGIAGKVQDHNGIAITQETLIGNGSKGHLQIRDVDFGDDGVYLYPQAVCITELVQFGGGEGTGIETDTDAFGIEELSEADMDELSVDADDLPDDDDDGVGF